MERIGDIGVFRLERESRLAPAVRQVADAIRAAREGGLRKLMVVTAELTGLRQVTVAERLQMVREWADAAQGRLMLAVVTQSDLIDPQRFGVVAAANFGLHSNVFTSEELARAWLDEQR